MSGQQPPPNDPALEQRLAALEVSLEELRGTVRSLIDILRNRGFDTRDAEDVRGATTAPRRVGAPAVHPRKSGPPPPPHRVPTAPDVASPQPPWAGRSGEWWLNRAGIGLLLLGVAFLFKYSVDQGWLTPWTRVAFGVGLGIALAAIGLRVERKQRWFTPVMLGGASATFYITGFAAFQLLQVVGYQIAFAFMIAATVFTLWCAIRQDEPVLGVLGASGALGTPFLLYTDAGSLAGLMGYNALVLAWTAGIYLYKGWRSLLWTSAAGGWSVVVIGLVPVMTDELNPSVIDGVAFQVGVIVALMATWAVPVMRHVLAARQPERWPTPPSGWVAKLFGKTGLETVDRSAAILAVAVPLVAFFTSREFWPLSDGQAASAAVAMATIFAATWWWLERHEHRVRLASSHAVAMAALLAIAVQYVLESHTLLLTWTVEAVALHVMAMRLDDRWVRRTAHALSAVVAIWLLQRLGGGSVDGAVVFNQQALTDLSVIGALAGATFFLGSRESRLAYAIGAHVAILGWLWRELSRVAAGEGVVTVAWGAYALALLVIGLRRDQAALRQVGLWTLAAVIAKLFLIDLDQVEAIWRILLFLGFGGVFLVVSYYFRALWKKG